MRTKDLYILLMVFSFFGCGKTPEVNYKVTINPINATEEINISEIADEIIYIKLETNDNCNIGGVHSVFIKSKYIYIVDYIQHIIFIFNKEGQFIAKLDKRGKGPEEYQRLGHIIIDDNETYIENITISGDGYYLNRYSNISFELLDVIPMPTIYSATCRKIDDIYYFATQQLDNVINNNRTNANLIIVKDGKVIKKLFDKNIITHGSGFSPNVESFIQNEKGDLFVTIMYENTFYWLDNERAIPFLNVDFGNYGINNEIGIEPIQDQVLYLKTSVGLASFPELKILNSNLKWISYLYRHSGTSQLFDKSYFRHYIESGNSIYHTAKIKNDITEFPAYFFNHNGYRGIAYSIFYEGYFVDIVLPNDYLNYSESITVEGIGEVKSTDNPIIVLMKRKEL